jgi:serine protease inhibitor
MKTTIRRLCIVVLALTPTACELATGTEGPLQELPRPLTAAESKVVAGSNRFAFDLLREVNAVQEGENLFLSPLSVSMALGMTMNGAAGTTFDEMRAGLGFGSLTQEEINASYRSLLDLLLGLDRRVEMVVANSVWYRRGFPFERSFLDTVERGFDADVRDLDFASPAAAATVNEWVSLNTRGKIGRILDAVGRDDVMYLINAIYFKGVWVQQFDRQATRADVFVGPGGRQIPVRMMRTSGAFRYASTHEYQAIDLPYGNGAYTMTIVLPHPGRDPNELIRSLDDAKWNAIVDGLVESRLDVWLPRFRLEYEVGLVEALQALGIRSAFVPGAADFSRMSGPAGTDLFISSVKHKTFVDVDEEGTEAAAVTKVTISVTSAPPGIRVDRPFLFAIRERFSGTILFTGKIVDPS